MRTGCVAILCLLTAASLASAAYSPKLAMESLFYSRTSNCPGTLVSNWTCGSSCDYFNGSMTDVSVYSNVSADTRAFVAFNAAANRVVLTIRGTRNIKNWIQDFDYFLIDYPHCDGCKVHRGFYSDFHGLNANGMMSGFLALIAKYPNASILVNGHSLGAGMATLAAAETLRGITLGNRVFELYTFGSPRVGNPAFVNYTGHMLPKERQHRLTHDMDPIPHLPPISFGFLHIPQEVFFKGNTSEGFKLCHGNFTAEDPHCADSQLPIDVYDHIWYLGRCMGCCGEDSNDDNCCKHLPL